MMRKFHALWVVGCNAEVFEHELQTLGLLLCIRGFA